MIMSEVIKKLALNLAMETGTMEDLPIYRKYIQMALCVGFEHYPKGSEEIVQMGKDGNEISRYKSFVDVEKKTGIAASSICEAISGKHGRKQAGGFLWVKANDVELIKRNEIIPEVLKYRELNKAKYH